MYISNDFDSPHLKYPMDFPRQFLSGKFCAETRRFLYINLGGHFKNSTKCQL